MTRGEKICAFIEHYCLIPEGAQVRTQIKLMTLATQVGACGRVEVKGNMAEKVIKALGLGYNKSIAF